MKLVVYNNRIGAWASVWMGSQLATRTKQSRYYNPVDGRWDQQSHRRGWCAVMGCMQKVKVKENPDTGNLSCRHTCMGIKTHTRAMYTWWCTRMWDDIVFVSGICVSCNKITFLKHVGNIAPLVLISGSNMIIIMHAYKLTLIVHFGPTKHPTPHFPGYTEHHVLPYDMLAPFRVPDRLKIRRTNPCADCCHVLKYPVAVYTSQCPECNTLHNKHHIEAAHEFHPPSKRNTKRRYFRTSNADGTTTTHGFVGCTSNRETSYSRKIDFWWRIPRPPYVSCALAHGHRTIKQCTSCHAQHVQKTTRLATQQSITVAKEEERRRILTQKRRWIGIEPRDDDDTIDVEDDTDNDLLIDVDDIVMCWVCSYHLPRSDSVNCEHLPSHHVISTTNPPTNPAHGFNLCRACISTCADCGDPALTCKSVPLCTACWTARIMTDEPLKNQPPRLATVRT